MTTVAELVVEISAKGSAFERALDGATRSVSTFVGNATKQIARIGAITVGALTGAGYLINRSFSEAADNIDMLSKAAERLNTPLGELQKLDFAAALADIDTSSLVRAMQLMGKNVFEAATQGGDAAKVFTRLGVNLQELNKLSSDEQFRKIADALQNVSSAGERSSLQMQIFGRSGLELTNLLNGSLKETDAQFKALGLGITTAQGKQVEAFNDTKTVLGKIFDGFKEKVAANVSPAFTAINNAIIKSVENMGGIETASTNFSLKIMDAALAGVNAFGQLSNAATAIGLVLDNIGTKIDILMAGFSRVANATSGLSFTNKTPAFKTLQNSDAGAILKLDKEFVDAANAVGTFANIIVAAGENVGEGLFKFNNPETMPGQMDKEFNIIRPGMEKYATNQEKAAESTRKNTAATELLSQEILKQRAILAAGNKTPDKPKPGEPGFVPGAGSTSGATPSASAGSNLFTGGRIPFSTDPAMDAILLKQAQDNAIIQKQFDDAKALRDKFPSVPFGTSGKGLATPMNAPVAIVRIEFDADGFFKMAEKSPRFSNVVTQVVADAVTDTATTGL